MSRFDEATLLTKLDENHYTFSPTEDWFQGRTLFGGVVVGAAVRALLETLSDKERVLRGVLVSFVAPVRDGSSEIKTHILRSGKGTTQIEARVFQGEQVCTVVQGSFGVMRSNFIEVPFPKMAEVPPPEEVVQMPFMEGVAPAFTQHVDYRWTVPSFPYTGSEAKVQGWVRFREDHPVGFPEIVGMLDAWPPPILSVTDEFAHGSSLTWMISFFGEAADYQTDEHAWWFYDADCTASMAGYADTSAEFRNREGKLLARTRQLVVEFSK